VTGLNLSVDPLSTTPPFEQIRVQLMEAVRTGALVPGDKLPTVRRLAEDLGLAPNTVARSYRALEQDEVIETRGRLGSFVAATGDAAQRQVQLAAVAYADRAASLGVDADEALAIVRAALGLSG
jgi:DNA-binding transcriptional regulator YhcF (GntR family)